MSFKYKKLIETVSKDAPFIPDITIILGSGLGDFAECINKIKSLNTIDLPDYPSSTIQGHKGKIHFAEYSGKNLLLFQGRIHFNEGYSIDQCILPVLLSYKLSCKKILLTNAAGGINTKFQPGDLMLNTSINSIYLKKELAELIGLATLDIRNRFLDFPSLYFTKTIKKAALLENVDLKEGIYWFTKGPSYETPAEIKMMRTFGADAVGMSTVHEAIYASYLGMETGIVSCITNYAAGISDIKLSHNDVTETADKVKFIFENLVKRIITLL